MFNTDENSPESVVPSVADAHKLGSGRMTRVIVAILVMLFLIGLVALFVLSKNPPESGKEAARAGNSNVEQPQGLIDPTLGHNLDRRYANGKTRKDWEFRLPGEQIFGFQTNASKRLALLTSEKRIYLYQYQDAKIGAALWNAPRELSTSCWIWNQGVACSDRFIDKAGRDHKWEDYLGIAEESQPLRVQFVGNTNPLDLYFVQESSDVLNIYRAQEGKLVASGARKLQMITKDRENIPFLAASGSHVVTQETTPDEAGEGYQTNAVFGDIQPSGTEMTELSRLALPPGGGFITPLQDGFYIRWDDVDESGNKSKVGVVTDFRGIVKKQFVAEDGTPVPEIVGRITTSDQNTLINASRSAAKVNCKNVNVLVSGNNYLLTQTTKDTLQIPLIGEKCPSDQSPLSASEVWWYPTANGKIAMNTNLFVSLKTGEYVAPVDSADERKTQMIVSEGVLYLVRGETLTRWLPSEH